jgi:hypothetical protein
MGIIIDIESAQEVNRSNRNMSRYIAMGSPDSEALAEVRLRQYDEAVARMQDAILEVMRLQKQNTELAAVEQFSEPLSRELDLLGL